MEDCKQKPTSDDNATEKSVTFCVLNSRLNPKAQIKKLPRHRCFLPRHVAGGVFDFLASSLAMDWRCQRAPASNN